MAAMIFEYLSYLEFYVCAVLLGFFVVVKMDLSLYRVYVEK